MDNNANVLFCEVPNIVEKKNIDIRKALIGGFLFNNDLSRFLYPRERRYIAIACLLLIERAYVFSEDVINF